MATHDELTQLFSPEGVITLDREEAVRNKIADADVDTLASVGLPAHLDLIFSLKVPGEPSAFSMVPIDTGDEVVNTVERLPGPRHAPSTRFADRATSAAVRA
ncbi:hypothetical protein ACIG5E_28505 [Kitasatospora sp. NPDC053057]|uniref:hypothetical protein n=1 Tax=Kitasatospora sp. NPDC053057 TaxID=3364062 RepID=UPI0037CCA833